MSDFDREVILETAERLNESMTGLRDEIAGLRLYGQRNRHLIWGLGVSLVLDLVLSVAVGILAVNANNTSNRADEATSLASRNLQTQLATCRASNDARAANKALWEFIINATSARGNQTAESAALVEQFRSYVNQVFAPRNCDNPSANTPIPTAPPFSVTPTR